MSFVEKLPRVAIVVSHPIQHFCPQYASLAQSRGWEICVFFGSSLGKEPYVDKGFKTEIAWTNLYLNEFPHVFLTTEVLASTPELDADNLDNELTRFDPDVIIIYGYWQKLQRRAKSWAIAANKKIYFISDTELHGVNNAVKRLAKIAKAAYRLRGVERVLTVGNANEQFYGKCGFTMDSMTRMNFPIDVQAYSLAYEHKNQHRINMRYIWGISENSMVIGNVGKFVSWKRQCDLIEAVALVPHKYDIRLVLAGSGPDADNLRKLAQDKANERILFVDFIDPVELPAFYASCDIYAHVSSYEPHSLAISEAIYMGLPIVVSKACGSYGTYDDVQPGLNGFVFETGNVKSLADAIIKLVIDDALREKFGAMSRSYSVESQSKAHGKFLEAALVNDDI